MAWVWRLEGADPEPLDESGIDNPEHGSQSDAETWVGEQWPALVEAGVVQVTLLRDGDVVYGPMPLAP